MSRLGTGRQATSGYRDDPRVIDEGHGFFRIPTDGDDGDWVIQPRAGDRWVAFRQHQLNPVRHLCDTAEDAIQAALSERAS